MDSGFFEALTNLPLLARFAIAMAVILTIPRLCQKILLPPVVGLLLAGVIFGPNGLGVAPRNAEVGHFFSEMGKLLLMFFAGLEIDLAQFQRSRNRSIAFGLLTFALPLAAGVTAGAVCGYGALGALLIGSLLASHTLLGYPIAQKLGLLRHESVTVTIGATIFTDVASLLVLAICIPIHTAGFSVRALIIQLLQLAVYVPLVLFGLSWLAKTLMGRLKDSKEGQFLVMLLAVVLAAIGAEAIHLEGIIGAFLAGIALNKAAHETRAKEELEFIGNTLFVPLFFIGVGYLIDVRVFASTMVAHLGLVLAIVIGLIVSKLAAALLAAKLFRYARNDAMVMWSLSLPQVAATLAAAMVAFEAKNADGVRLIDEPVVNSVIVLMVVTSVLGPILTEVYGKRLAAATGGLAPSGESQVSVEHA